MPVSAMAGEDGASAGDLLEDEEAKNKTYDSWTDGMREDMDNVLSTLSWRESGVLRMRYGLDDGHPATLDDIGKAFNVRRFFLLATLN